jgi:hypothetical protein
MRARWRERTIRREAIRRGEGDRGAALLETLVVAPVFFLLIFGILEFGLIYRDYLTVGDAVTVGARSGAIVGPGTADIFVDDGSGTPTEISVNGDFAVMKSVREGMVAVPIDWIDRIVVFRVDPNEAGSQSALELMPDACKTGVSSAAHQCNVYQTRESFLALEGSVSAVDLDHFDCVTSGDPACGWPPDDRCNGQASHCPSAMSNPPTSRDIDFIGVYIKINRSYLTGIFGDAFTFEQAHILRLEPGDVGGS